MPTVQTETWTYTLEDETTVEKNVVTSGKGLETPIKTKQPDGTWMDIPVIVGPQGPEGPKGADGASATIKQVTASVDSSAGVPSVTVVTTGTPMERSFEFQFKGLKGQSGEPGK